jgi:serine protease Do
MHTAAAHSPMLAAVDGAEPSLPASLGSAPPIPAQGLTQPGVLLPAMSASPAPTHVPQRAKWMRTPAAFISALAVVGVATGAGGFGVGAGLAHGRPTNPASFLSQARGLNASSAPDFADLAAKVKPAVVSIAAATNATRNRREANADLMDQLPEGLRDFFAANPERMTRRVSAGSGFIISADGYIVTNGHVVGDANEIRVTTDAGKVYPARVIGFDRRSDIALLRVDASGLPYVRLGQSMPRIGDWVLAVGDPFGLGGTVTAGIVSGRGRDIGAGPYDDFLQIDAPINQGNSGGPSFNLAGDVVGMNTAILSPSGGSIGLGFAIPAPMIARIVSDLKGRGEVERGWLGVSAQPLTQDMATALDLSAASGVLIDDLNGGGPAAGKLAPGDVILRIDGAAIADTHDLARTIAAHHPGDSVTLDVLRRGHTKHVVVELGKLPPDPA